MKKLFRKLFPNKEQKAFDKMHRRHRKELVKHAKETDEFNWYWLHKSIIMQIQHMYEYYTENNNVWQADEKRLMVIEQLKHVLDLEAEIDQMELDCDDVKVVHKDGVLTCVFPDDYNERCQKYEEKEQGLYEELYSSIGKNLRWWWD